MKIGVSLKIDVTKLDKNRFYIGQKGTYADLTVFIDTENPGQYGDHGGISQSVTKEERANQVKMPFVGNAKVFWEGQSQGKGGYQNQQGYQGQQENQPPQQQYQPQGNQQQGYQKDPMGQPQSGYSQGQQGNQDNGDIPF